MSPDEQQGHAVADVAACVTCECGATFEGESEGTALARWYEHAQEADQ